MKNQEERLAKLLSAIEGAGEVRVMIRAAATGEYVIEKDVTSQNSSGLAWDRSTRIPACSMAFTALRPKSVSPVVPGAVTPLPISVAPFQVRVHMRTPSRWRSWICSSFPPSAAPLSTVRMAPWRGGIL